MGGNHILSPDIGEKYSDWFMKCYYGCIFLSGINLSVFLSLNLAIYRIGSAQNIPWPRCKEQDDSHPDFTFYCKISKITLD